MKKILIPTDFSAEADNAVKIASYIAKKSGAEIHLLHVMDVSMGGSFNTTGEVATQGIDMDQLFVLKLMEVNKKRMHALADQFGADGIQATYEIQVGHVFNTIIAQVEEKGIDLIVMGTKGSTGFTELLVGSNTEKIVRFASCPVLSVRNVLADFKVEDIVFASTFENDQLVAVSKLKRFQQLFGAKIHMVYINVPNNFVNSRVIKQRMTEFAQKYQLTDYDFTIYNDSSEEEGIIHFADETGADLITVATHGRSGLAHLLSGSIAEDIVNHANRPVLTFNLKTA